MSSTRMLMGALAIVAMGCSSSIDTGRGGHDERVGTQTSALIAPDASSYHPQPPPANAPWLVLLCYASDQSPGDAAVTSQLKQLFASGLQGNMWDYWNQQSNGQLSADIQVFGWFQTPYAAKYESDRVDGITDCVIASGIDPGSYFNVVAWYAGNPVDPSGVVNDLGTAVGLNLGFQCSQNGGCEGPATADAGSCPSQILHEMGHGMSLDHSYDDTTNDYAGSQNPGEYGDPWDIMSVLNARMFSGSYSTRLAVSQGGSQTGPGLNMWNRLKLGWIPSSRVTSAPATPSSSGYLLTSRSRNDLAGPQMLVVPATSTYEYTVEYASRDGFDLGTAPVLLIHRIYFGDAHSYLVRSLANGIQYFPGYPFLDATAGVSIALDPLTDANPAYALVVASTGTHESVLSVEPATGQAGDQVTIHGMGLAGKPITFGSSLVTPSSCTVASDSTTDCTVLVPAGDGVVDVRAGSGSDVSLATSADQFAYVPVMTSISPAFGTNMGGWSVTIQGIGFEAGATTFIFDGTSVTATCTSTTECFVSTPGHAPGSVQVTAVVAGVPSSNSVQYTYEYLPHINGLTLSPPTMFGGHTVTGTVALDEAAETDVSVTLSVEGGSEASLLSFKSTPLTIHANNNNTFATFTIEGPAAFSIAESVTIVAEQASADETHRLSIPLSLLPGADVYLSLPAISAATGPLTWNGTVTIDAPAPDVGASVQLSTSLPSEITLPPGNIVNVGKGSTTASFQVTAAGGSAVGATVTATYGGGKSTSDLQVIVPKPIKPGGCTGTKCQ